MEALGKVNYGHQPLHLSLHHRRTSFSRPFSSLSFRTPPPPPSLKSSSIKSSSSSNSNLSFRTPKPQLFKTLIPFSYNLLRTTFISAVTAALFFARFHLKPLIAAPISPPATVESATDDAVSDEDKDKTLEDRSKNSLPEDAQSLKNLMESKIKDREIHEAIRIIEQLIKLEPNDAEWPLLKAHMHIYSGDLELAKLGFNQILSKDPLRVEAYHGLVLAASQAESVTDLREIEKRIEEAMEKAKKEGKKEDFRDFKLLLAQIRVIEGEYNDGLKIYKELVKEDPRDFRPYLCQGIIYTLLREKNEAEKNFQKYRRLVPSGHPYAQYFDDNMMATKLFSQKVENERVGSRR